jgi:hypothetical protein
MLHHCCIHHLARQKGKKERRKEGKKDIKKEGKKERMES